MTLQTNSAENFRSRRGGPSGKSCMHRPGSKEITHSKFLLEHIYLTCSLDLWSSIPVHKNKFFLIRIISCQF